MSNNDVVTFRKTPFFIAVIILLIALVALIFLCRAQPDDNGFARLVSVLKSKEVVALAAIEAGGTSLLDLGGNDLEPCGESNPKGGDITGNCDFQDITLKAVDEIMILRTEENPNCMDIRVGGNWYSVHETDDTQTPWRWKKRHFKCHTAPRSEHAYLN